LIEKIHSKKYHSNTKRNHNCNEFKQ